MKKSVLSSLLLVLVAFAHANPATIAGSDSTKNWKFGGFAGLTFTQIAFYQWAQGGQNSLSFIIDANGFANYKKGKHSWDNSVTLKWGMTALGYYRRNFKTKFPFKKSDDLLDITSKYGYNIAKNLDLGAMVNFKSMISNSYRFYNDTTLADHTKYQENNKAVISHFLAPANLTLGIGIDYKPQPYFSLYFSPLTGKLIIVKEFFDRYEVDETKFGVEKGKTVNAQLGAYLRAAFQKDIIKNINYKTQLEVFLTYTDKEGWKKSEIKPLPNGIIPPYGGPVDVDWQNDLVFKVNKYIQATLSWRLLYDHRTLVPVDSDRDYVNDPIYKRGVQIRQAFGLTFGYKF